MGEGVREGLRRTEMERTTVDRKRRTEGWTEKREREV